MSDFLNNLIVRNYGLKPVVQPRLASRFEPLPENLSSIQDLAPAPHPFMSTDEFAERSTARALSFHEPDAKQSFGESVTEETAPETPRTAPTAQQLSRPLKTEWRPDDAARPLRPASSSALDDDVGSARSLGSAPHPRSDVQESADRAAQDPGGLRIEPDSILTIQKAAEFLLNERRRHERESGGREANHPFEATTRGREEQLARAGERLAAEAASRAQDKTELSRRAIVPVRTTAQPNVSEGRAPAVAAGSRSGVEVESSSPTIRVTIGRVDVRAVMPEAGAGKPRAAAAPARPQHGPQSLEEYLKQRNGGGR